MSSVTDTKQCRKKKRKKETLSLFPPLEPWTPCLFSRVLDPFLLLKDPGLLINLPNNYINYINLFFFQLLLPYLGFPGGSDGKASVCNAGDSCSIPGWGDPLEKEMTAQSSILSGKIPWTVKPGRLLSMGSQRVGHD